MTSQEFEQDYPIETRKEIDAAKLDFTGVGETQDKAVRRIGNALALIRGDHLDGICTEIKHILHDEIVAGLISERRIEQICPSHWKNGDKAEAGKLGGKASAEKISPKPRQQVVITNNGSATSVPNDDSTTFRVNALENKMQEMQETLDRYTAIADRAKEISNRARELDGQCDCDTCKMAREMSV